MPYDFDAAVGYTAPNYATTNSYLDYQINSVTDVQLTNIMSFRKVNVDGPNTLTLNGFSKPIEVPDASVTAPIVTALLSVEIKVGDADFTDVELEFNADTNEYTLADAPSEKFHLRVKTKLNPAANTTGEGLYVGDPENNILSTQGESQGFREQTLFQDTPDIRCPFSMSISADKLDFPTLLGNGNVMVPY